MIEEHLQRLEKLEKEMAELQKRVATMYLPVRHSSWSVIQICPVCQIRFDGPMGYVCYQSACPMRVTCTS
jgi:hypothetical protein